MRLAHYSAECPTSRQYPFHSFVNIEPSPRLLRRRHNVNALEISANAVMTLSIWLAARNSVHTWSTGIAGCILFAAVFFHCQLYADATLQVFFIATSCIGWWQWTHRGVMRLVIELPVTKATHAMLAAICLAVIVILACYGWLLHRFTNACLPYVDSAVLALSLAAQLLLMRRKLETW